MHSPSPDLFFETIKAYQHTAALKGALDLDLFAAIGNGATISELADRCNASKRGIQILCDYLTVIGFLTKNGDHYTLTTDSATFLNPQSSDYIGSAADYLLSNTMLTAFSDIATTVRQGGTTLSPDGFLAPEHPVWEQYARGMTSVMRVPARLIAEHIDPEANQPLKVLDIAAGHGLFGLAFAERNSQTRVTALDWPNVLTIATENADKANLTDRFQTIAGSVLEADYGTNCDIAIVANLLHHFNTKTCITILKKVHTSLKQNGRAIILEFIPNNDRITPEEDAAFALVALATTPKGNVYTFTELNDMCCKVGFKNCTHHALGNGEQQFVIATK